MKSAFLAILQGMRTTGGSSEFPFIRILKVGDDDFKLFVNGNYRPNPETLDADNNGGHWTGEDLADYLEELPVFEEPIIEEEDQEGGGPE